MPLTSRYIESLVLLLKYYSHTLVDDKIQWKRFPLRLPVSPQKGGVGKPFPRRPPIPGEREAWGACTPP